MKRQILFLYTVLLIVSINIIEANNNNDSLENVLQAAKADTTICRLLNVLSWNYKESDSKKALGYAKKAIILAKKNNLTEEQGAAYNNIGALYYLVKNLDTALINYNMAKALFEKAGNKKRSRKCLQNIAIVYSDKSDYKAAIDIYNSLIPGYIESKDSLLIANIYNNIGNVYNLMGNYDLAMRFFIKSIEIYEKIGEKTNQANVFYNMGALHFYKGSYDKALEYTEQSLKIREEIHNNYGIAYSNLLKGVILEAVNKFDEALRVYKIALKIDEELGDKHGIASLLLNISNVYLRQEKFPEAKKHSIEALRVIKETGIIKLQLNIYNNIGNIEMQMKNYKEAFTNFMQSRNLSDSTGDKLELKDAYNGLSRAAFSINDYKNAYTYLLKHMNIKDTLFNEEKNKQLTEMDTKYQSEKKQKEIDLLNIDKDFQNMKIKKQREQLIGVAFGFILMLVLSVVIFKSYRHKKKANKKLQELNVAISFQKHEIEEKNDELNQQNEEIRTQRDEIENQRDEIIAQRDLVTIQKNKIEQIHHEISQSISYAKLIQTSIFPDLEILKNHFESYFVLFKPRDVVSGDFYWVVEVENYVVATVADCTGHGVPGAFMSMLGISFLREIILKEYITEPAVILRRMRKEIINSLQQKGVSGEQKDGMDMALISINTKTLELQFAGANNPIYIVKTHNDTSLQPVLTEIRPDKMPIAIYEKMDKFNLHTIQLDKSDSIYLMSDGFEDQFGGPKNKKFLSKNLKSLLTANSQLPMVNQKEILENSIANWMGNGEQIDDITIFGLKI